MTPERWQSVKEVLHQALQLQPQERSAFLERACSSDLAIRHEVENLVTHRLATEGHAQDYLLDGDFTPAIA